MTDPPDTITITVKSFATLREVMEARTSVDLPGDATIRTLLDRLTRQYPGLDGQIFSAPGTLRDLVNILRNGRNIAFLAGLDTPLSDGDLVALFPPVAGG
jgi:MoaD family protein